MEEVNMKDDLQFLKELQQELLTQDNDCQAAPRFWSIMDYQYEPTAADYADRVVIFNQDSCMRINIEEYIENVLDGDEFTDEQKEELKEAVDGVGVFDLKEWLEEYENDDVFLIYEREIPVIAWNTCFFTKEEAKRHLENNRHHYSDKAHTFAMTAWRAPKMERLMKILETFDWDAVEIKKKEKESHG